MCDNQLYRTAESVGISRCGDVEMIAMTRQVDRDGEAVDHDDEAGDRDDKRRYDKAYAVANPR